MARQRWEYKIIGFTDQGLFYWNDLEIRQRRDHWISSLGDEGWELTGVAHKGTPFVPGYEDVVFVFKRPREDAGEELA